jgi:copper(I)-binding protein
MRKTMLGALALGIAALGPAGCGEEPAAEAEAGTVEGIAITNARLMLPAVAGNPGAVYFDLANSGERDRMIRAASVEGAGSAMMHATEPTGMQETLQVMAKAGETVKFEPGGTHVMAMNLADTIAAGGQANVTVTFVGGDEVTFPAEVRAAGDER